MLFHLGKISYNRRCLHDIGNTPNPYEQAISIIGRTLSAFDEDNLIPCFGFGDGKLKVPIFFFVDHGFSMKCLNECIEYNVSFRCWQHQLMTRRYSAFIQRTNHAMDLKRHWKDTEKSFQLFD